MHDDFRSQGRYRTTVLIMWILGAMHYYHKHAARKKLDLIIVIQLKFKQVCFEAKHGEGLQVA